MTNYPGGPREPYRRADPDAYSPWLTRAGGFLIDLLVAAIPAWILEFIGRLVGHGVGGFIAFLGGVLAFVVVAWNRWYLGGLTGQSLGRGTVGVRVISELTGQPVGPLMAFVRDIAHLVDSLICWVGWLFPLWDAKRQTIGDKIMSTVAVPAAKVSPEQTLKTGNR